MKKILIGIIILGIFIASFLSHDAYAEQRVAVAAEKAVILFMEGDVKVKSAEAIRWVVAAVGAVLSRGDSLKTGSNSWVEIGFGKGYRNVVRVKERTLLELIDLDPIKIGLLKGEVRSLVERLSRDTTFEIKTPTAVCGARGTGWDTNTDGRKVIVDAYEDEVYFYGLSKDGTPIMDDPIIKAGKRGILEDPTKPITIKDLPVDRMKDWNKWKEDFRDRRGGEKKDIEGKAKKTEGAQKTIEDMMKGKKGTFEKKDQDKMDERIKGRETSSGHKP